jgi:hypothetical protein
MHLLMEAVSVYDEKGNSATPVENNTAMQAKQN